MLSAKKKSERLKGKKFFEGIKFWQKQIAGLKNVKLSLKRSETEVRKFPQKLHEQVELRTAAERIIIKQLHHEIEERKNAEWVTQDARAYAENIVDTVREPLIVLDSDLRVVTASRSFCQIFKVKREDTEKQHIYELGDRQWDIPKLRELLEGILPKTASFDDFEVTHEFPGIGTRIMLLNARKVYRKTNHTQLILLAIEDITERRGLEAKLEILASHDELTGCLNFRAATEFLENEILRSQRYQKQFSAVMIDIDDFKKTNDAYGHLAGNDILASFAAVIKNSLRSIDMVGRYGGEEFLVVLPETDAQHAQVVLERIRHNLAQAKVISTHLKAGTGVALEFSGGIAVFPHTAKDLKGLIAVADDALLQAKREGKNRVIVGHIR